jgi:hypothetical protein
MSKNNPITVKKLRELLIDLEINGHGKDLVFLSRDPEGNGFNGLIHNKECSGVTFDGVTWEGKPVIVLWAGAPEHVELEFEDN